MALIMQKIKEKHPKAFVIYRFIGVTPDSSNARALMYSVYSQVLFISLFQLILKLFLFT